MREEFQRETGEWPPYPRSRIVLQELQERLNEACRQRIPESILDEPIPEDVKERLPKPLHPGKYRPFPPPRKKKTAQRKVIEENFDPTPRQKSLRTVKDYEDEIWDLFVETDKLVFSQNPSVFGNYVRSWRINSDESLTG